MIKGIIFDLDNTLIDFMRMKETAIEAAILSMIDAGLEMTRDEAHEKIFDVYNREGIEYQQVFDVFLKDDDGRVDPKILAAGIVGYRRARWSAMVLYPHVKFTLTELIRRGLCLAVISDAPALQAWLRLCQLQLHHMFDPVITFDNTGVFKPDPKPFRLALERMKLSSEDVLMIGDWPERDMVGASQVGIRTVFARYGNTFGTTHSGADFDIESIDELLAIVEQLSGGSEVGS